MIHMVQYMQYPHYTDNLDEMHRLRARVFAERLQWDVRVENGQERDEFDQLKPLYLLSIDETGALEGSLRLLPTTGPTCCVTCLPGLTLTGCQATGQ